MNAPLTPDERNARRQAWLPFQAQLAHLDARLARIDCAVGALEAEQRQRRRAQAQAARAAAAAHQREYESAQAARQQRMAGGLTTAFLLGAGAVVSGASMRHPMGLRELDGARGPTNFNNQFFDSRFSTHHANQK